MSGLKKNDTPSNTEVYVYHNNDYGGMSDSFTDDQSNLHSVNWPSTLNNESTDYSSLKVGSGLTLTVYTDKNYGGASGLFYGNGGSNGDGCYDNLKDNDSYTNLVTGYSNNWDDAIRSFALTSNHPGYFPADIISNWRAQYIDLYASTSFPSPTVDPKTGDTDDTLNPYIAVEMQGITYNVYYPCLKIDDTGYLLL